MKASDQEIEIVQEKNNTFFLKGGKIRMKDKFQAYEAEEPFLISNIKNVFIEELSSSICALANQPDGGNLLIC